MRYGNWAVPEPQPIAKVPWEIPIKTWILKSQSLTYIVTTPVTASIRTSRVRLSVGTDDGERLRLVEGKSTIVLQKDDALLADFSHDTTVGRSTPEFKYGKPEERTWRGRFVHRPAYSGGR